MNLPTIIIGLIVAVIFFGALHHVIKSHKSGSGSCGCGCEGCSGHCNH